MGMTWMTRCIYVSIQKEIHYHIKLLRHIHKLNDFDALTPFIY